MGDSDMSGISLSSVGHDSLYWVAATVDWDFESEETNQEVIFAGQEGNEESINM